MGTIEWGRTRSRKRRDLIATVVFTTALLAPASCVRAVDDAAPDRVTGADSAVVVDTGTAPSSPQVVPPVADEATTITAWLKDSLAPRGFGLERVVASSENLHVVIGRRPETLEDQTTTYRSYPGPVEHTMEWRAGQYFQDGEPLPPTTVLDTSRVWRDFREDMVDDGFGRERVLVVVGVSDDSIAFVSPARSIQQFFPVDHGWLRLGMGDVDGFWYAFDDVIENAIGVTVFHGTQSHMEVVFEEDVVVRRPSKLQDLNGDGVPELVVPVEAVEISPFFMDCHDAVVEASQLDGAFWPEVRAWDGDRFEVSEGFSGFYSALAAQYDSVVTSLGTDLEVRCGPTSAEVFAKWKGRALERAAGR